MNKSADLKPINRWLSRSLQVHRWLGLMAAPILILLGATGAMYLFRDGYDDLRYGSLRRFAALQVQTTPLPIEVQIQRATVTYPRDQLTSIVRGNANGRTTELTFRRHGQTQLVYVHPMTGDVLGMIDRDSMLMRRVRDLHGNLMTGVFGSALVEMAAYWLLALMLTGMLIWMPKKRWRLASILYPRLNSSRRVLLRDLHSVPAVYFSAGMLMLVGTGLPWSGGTGSIIKRFQESIGGSVPPALARRVEVKASSQSSPTISAAQAFEICDRWGMLAESVLNLPRRGGVYQGVYREGHRSSERGLLIDPHDGRVLQDIKWSQMPLAAKTISLGIRLHQGELFGWPNFVAMLATSIAVVATGLTGMLMFAKRKYRLRRS